MPSILSKILMPEWNVPYNCYELGHTWTPFCTEAALEIGLIVFNQALKLYTPLYLGNQVLQKKFDRKSFLECFQSVLRSSVFLGINAFLVILFFCFTRLFLGRFYYSLCAYVPSFFGSLLAILNERPPRRKALAFYVANISSETLFRILISRGYIKEIPNGKFYMFSIAITILLFLYETDLLQDPLIKFVFQLIIGTNKSGSNVGEDMVNEPELLDQPNPTQISKINSIKENVHHLWSRIKVKVPVLNHRHPACAHRSRNSCFENVVLQSFLKPFTLGWLSQLSWRAASKLMSGHFRDAFQTFRPEQMFSKRYTSFALSLSLFTTLYNLNRCLMCHVTDSNQPWQCLVAAFVASLPTVWVAPSTSMTLYLVWKCAESLFTVGAKKGIIPYNQLLVPLIYALAASQLFNAAILDPGHVKPSYKRFIDRITQNKLKFINRNVLEVFGTNASKGYESFLPVYDLKYTTRRFQESVLVWLL